MERKSFGWLWAGLGLVAVGVLIVSGLSRRHQEDLTAMPAPMQPVIVEPIQPAAENAAPVTPVPAVAPAPAAVSSDLSLPLEGVERARGIQLALRAAGYDPGLIDGKLGRRTQKAIRDFQEAQGLSVDGKVGPKTWAKLEPYLSHASASASTTE